MKRLLNTLRLVWKILKVISLLRTIWGFLRDHFDDFLEIIGW